MPPESSSNREGIAFAIETKGVRVTRTPCSNRKEVAIAIETARKQSVYSSDPCFKKDGIAIAIGMGCGVGWRRLVLFKTPGSKRRRRQHGLRAVATYAASFVAVSLALCRLSRKPAQQQS